MSDALDAFLPLGVAIVEGSARVRSWRTSRTGRGTTRMRCTRWQSWWTVTCALGPGRKSATSDRSEHLFFLPSFA